MALDNESFDILLSTVQRFVRERLVPAENHLEEHDEVSPELVDAMKEMGLFGLTVPEEFGGIGLSVSQEVQVNFELGRTAPAFRSVFGTNIGIGSQGILMDGTPEQKAEYLPRVASGELVMSFALTEPDAGSDAASLKTNADLDGDHYVLNGTKRFITNAPRAGAFTLMARTGGPGASGVSAFIVPADLPGIKLGKKDKKMGQRGTMTCDVILENVGAATWKGAIRTVAKGGRIVTCGATSGPIAETDIRLVFWKQISIIGSTMSNDAEFNAVMGQLFAGRLRAIVDTVMPLRDGVEAQRRLAEGKQFGKIVLTP